MERSVQNPREAGRDLASRPGPDAPGRRSRAAFWLLATVQATLVAAITLLTGGLPALQAELGLARAELALVSAAYGLALSGALLLGGRVADRVGWRRTFGAGILLFAAASALGAGAASLPTLLAARSGQGLGAALAAPAALALAVGTSGDPAHRDRARAIWGVLSGSGAAFGLIASGVLAAWGSWRWSFAAPAMVAGAALAAAPGLLPRGPEPGRVPLDLPGAALATAGLASLGAGLVAVDGGSWSSARVLGPLGVAGALLALFAVVERRREHPLLPLSFLRPPRRAAALAAILLTAASGASSAFLLALYLQQVRGFSPLRTSGAFLPYALTPLVGVAAGPLVARAGAPRVVGGGLALAGAGLALLARLGAGAAYAPTLLAGQVVATTGISLAFAGATVLALDGVRESEAGLAGGVLNTAMELGAALGVALWVPVAAGYAARLEAGGSEAGAATAAGYGFALGGSAIAHFLAAVAFGVAFRRLRARRPR